MAKAKKTLPTLIGVGVSDENGIPVHYRSDEGVVFTVYVWKRQVKDIDNNPVDAKLARHAIHVVMDIVDAWKHSDERLIDDAIYEYGPERSRVIFDNRNSFQSGF